MVVVRATRQQSQLTEVVVSVLCDRCGVECSRPGGPGLGRTAPFYSRLLARPDDNGNEPHVDAEHVLCHDCADAFVRWVRDGSSA